MLVLSTNQLYPTTLDGFIVKANVIAKNIVENNTALNPGISGIIPISKVVAAVLGIARSGPKHIIIAEPKIIANNLPASTKYSSRISIRFS